MNFVYILSVVAIAHCYRNGELEGNLQPIGLQRKSEGHIDIFEDVPDVRLFFNDYIKGSKPAVFKGAAKNIPAFTKWTDEYMKEVFGDLKVDVEEGKKENRSLDMWTWTFKEFLEKYQTADIYMVHSLESKMREDLRLLPSLSCGGFSRVLSDVVMWFSSGGTKSVLHNDHIDNINCLFSGSKKLFMVDYKHREHIDIDAPNGGFSLVDVDSVDLSKYPGLSKAPWWEAEMETGDCLFIPQRWFHQVRSFTDNNRNMAVNVWFHNLLKLNLSDCETSESVGKYLPIDKLVLRDLEAVRYLLALDVQDEPLSTRKMAKLILAHSGGGLDKKLLKDLIKILDQDGDKKVTIEEINNLTVDELKDLSTVFPGLESSTEDTEEVIEEELGEESEENLNGNIPEKEL